MTSCQVLDSGLNTSIKKEMDKAVSAKVQAGFVAASLKHQSAECFVPSILVAAKNACTSKAIIGCWRKVGLWPVIETDQFIADLEIRGVFAAEDDAARRVDAPISLEGFKTLIHEKKQSAALVTSTHLAEDRVEAAIWPYRLAVPELVLTPDKRRPVHGVGAGKFNGHYGPVNIGPRSEALQQNLMAEATRVEEVRKRHIAKVCPL